MMMRFRRSMSYVVAVSYALLPFHIKPALASEHLVALEELQEAVAGDWQSRQKNLEKLEAFFASDLAKQALGRSPLQSTQVKSAVRHLSDEELARLTVQTDRIRRDFAAGALTNQQITYILIALGTAVLILVFVLADDNKDRR
ncbi:MAG: hypothetical protein AB1898_22320 [Acidobacteriota bacterium]